MEQRTLELTIRHDIDRFEVDIYDPESGECSQLDFPVSFDEHPEFNQAIGNEIYSWLALWMDADDES